MGVKYATLVRKEIKKERERERERERESGCVRLKLMCMRERGDISWRP